MNSFYLFTDGILFLPNISRLHISRLPYLSIHKYLTTMVTMAGTEPRHRTLEVTGMSPIFTTNLDNCSLFSVYPSLGIPPIQGADWGLFCFHQNSPGWVHVVTTQTCGKKRGAAALSAQCLLVVTRWWCGGWVLGAVDTRDNRSHHGKFVLP